MDKEKEFRHAFFFLKRCAKSPLLPSYTRGYSAGNGDVEPAKRVYEYLISLQKNASDSYEEKLNLLNNFLANEESEQRKKPFMGSPFYSNLKSYIRHFDKQIQRGESIQTRREDILRQMFNLDKKDSL